MEVAASTDCIGNIKDRRTCPYHTFGVHIMKRPEHISMLRCVAAQDRVDSSPANSSTESSMESSTACSTACSTEAVQTTGSPCTYSSHMPGLTCPCNFANSVLCVPIDDIVIKSETMYACKLRLDAIERYLSDVILCYNGGHGVHVCDGHATHAQRSSAMATIKFCPKVCIPVAASPFCTCGVSAMPATAATPMCRLQEARAGPHDMRCGVR